MNAAYTPNPLVTIVLVPRERFSSTQQAIESIYDNTRLPFKLVFVDGNSPANVKRYLQQQAQKPNVTLHRTDYYLSPNQARNIGLSYVDTPYLVFYDNDVVVTPGWLEALVRCAEDTQADVVTPLTCQGEPVHQIVHCAGGDNHVWTDNRGRRRLREKMNDQGKTVAQVRDRLQRQETELAEFHCVFVRRSIFDRTGKLDEQMMNTKEHLDFCMKVREVGGKIYFEPDSLITYLFKQQPVLSDLPYYMLRWSDAWQLASLSRLRENWDLAEDGYFQAKYKKIGCRRRMTIIGPLVQKLTFGLYSPKLDRLLTYLDRRFNRYLTDRHARQTQTADVPPQSPSKTLETPQKSYGS